jgi:geranylgeranyl diphosphate synthase type II
VDKALKNFLRNQKGVSTKLSKAMSYSVFAGGKRLRPLLCLAAAEVCGGSAEGVMPGACALEILHTYSLIHDDLPAMDDDDLRRGRPTNHRVFGEGIAILAGDALLTRAFELLAQNAQVPGVKAPWVISAVELLARSAGFLGMVGGQAVDLDMAGRADGSRRKNKKILNTIHSHKTGALFQASLGVGALLVGASASQRRVLDLYGRHLGLAFQIADDILDLVGNKTLLGKRGSDRDNHKLTYPSIYGLDVSREKAKRAVHDAEAALTPFGSRGQILRELANFVIERNS